jgi:protein-tyrosine-phosphatase
MKRTAIAAGKRFLPKAFIDEIQKCRSYPSSERPLYLKLRLLNALGVGIQRPLRLQGCRSILFVCFGNIMRSPMCEALMLRETVKLGRVQISVKSAGLNATEGRAAHPWAVAAARELEISLEQHRARLLTDQMVNQADLIFAMDFQNYAQLVTHWPNIRKKVFMLSVFAEHEHKTLEIADPFHMGLEETRSCYRILNSCIQNLANNLSFPAQLQTARVQLHATKNSAVTG